MTADEAEALPAGTVSAVVIGDAGDDLSYRNLDVAFRLVRGGAELLAMHRNPWWLTDKGETLDAGGFVAGSSSRPVGRRGSWQAIARGLPAGHRRAARRP